jgi:biopolymer transport protein ExbB
VQALSAAWEFLLAGGPVMWPLLALSGWLWFLVLYKAAWLLRVRREELDPSQAVACLLERTAPAADGPRGAALVHFLGQPSHGPRSNPRLWQAAVRRQGPGLWRHLDTILVLAAVAPLLGLLGTVTGMIQTFHVIADFGTGNAQAMAGGIRQALITTETGLLVAIPGLFAGYVLRRQVRKLQQGLSGFAQAVGRWLRSREEAAC